MGGNFHFACRSNQTMGVERISMDRLRISKQQGFGVIELMVAGLILVIAALTAISLVVMAIAVNQHNKIDSTQTMLAESVIEQVNSTIIGGGTSGLTDCAGNSWTINTAPGGSALSGSAIDYTESSPPSNYNMQYVVKTPCLTSGTTQAVYDVRWNVSIVGAPTNPTNSYEVIVGAKRVGSRNNAMVEPSALTLRAITGN